MKKFSIFVAFLLLGLVGLQAAPVDVNKARIVADRYVRISGLYDKSQKVNQVTDITSQTPYREFYVFRIEGTVSGKGFVLVSADDCARPVLGYSAEENFGVEGIPAHVDSWLRGYEREIQQARETGVRPSEYTRRQWDNLLNDNREYANHTVVSALVQTRWNQSPYYNNLCPYDSTQSARSVTGCVATAMAQLMKYWNRPVQGTGSHSYNSNYGTLSANFGATTYDWSHMPAQLNSNSSATEVNAVATLMFHCGVAVEMDYSPSGSGATTIGRVASWYTAECALFNYFGYNSSLQGQYMSGYSDLQWKQMLMNDLNAGRPIIYRGSSDGGGHCFICDGFDSDTNFHFNLGWGGSSNGFYSLSAVDPNALEYNGSQGAIFGIYPNNMPLMMPAGVQVTGTNTTTATLTWINPNNAGTTQVQVAYGPSASFNLNSSSTYTTVTVSANTCTLSGLSSYTGYSVALRSVAGSTTSAWTEPVTFTTLASPQTPPALLDCENGIPPYWTQEYVSGNVSWRSAAGGYNNNHPTGAMAGSHNLLLQANGRGSVTRLVSPMLLLTQNDGHREYSANVTAKVMFGHAQANWAGDIDHLSVYYRTSPTADWNLLTSYTEEISAWRMDTLDLPNPTNTYQVAFEGQLDYGYGVCLDNIGFLVETESNDSVVVYDDTIACDSYTVTDRNGTRTITQAGTFRLVYTGASGIDSIIWRTVLIRHATHSSSTASAMGRYIWHDSTYTESGTHVYTYTNAFGCASADTLHLTIVPCTTEYRNQYVEACDEYTWSNYVTYYESTNEAYDTLTVDGGCPLIMRLNLTIYHSTHNNYSATAMNTYTWHDSLYFETGAFPYHYNDVHNCPSADTLHLTITPAPPVVVDSLHPYFETFEGDFTWYLQSGTAVNRWAYGTATANGGTHALYISNNRGHTNHYDITKRSIAYASKLFTLGRGTHYIGYDWKCYGENNYDYLRVFLAPASAHFNGDSLPSGNPTAATNTYLHTVPDGWIGLDDSTKLNLQSNWQSFTAEANVTTPGDYRLIFLWIDDASVGTDPPAAIDDISIELVNCGRPSNLAVDDIHPDRATLSWIGTGTQYQVAYGTGTNPDQMTTLTTTNSTLTLTGLSGSTTYHVYVRNVCSPSLNSAWSGMATFTTPFPPVVVDETHPFSDDFEGPFTWWMANGNRTNCWYWGTAASNGGTHSIYISNNSGNNNTYNNSSTGVTYATKLFALKSGTYHVAYDWRAQGERTSGGTNYDYLRVFLAPGNTSVTPGTTLPNGTTSTSAFANVVPTGWIAADSGEYKNMANTWRHFESDVAIPDSGDYVMLFVWITDGSAGDNPPAAVDNVNITRPSCAAPNNLHATSVYATSATVAWAGNGNNYRLAYGVGNNPDGMTQRAVTGMDYTLTGLAPNTLYSIYVRGVCDNNTMTAWAGPLEVPTPCNPYTITASNPLTENFENGMPGCWRTIYPCDNNAISITSNINSSTSYNSSHSLRFTSNNSCSNGYDQYFISQEISCAAPIQMSFHYRDYNQNNNIWVGYSTTGNLPELITNWVEVPNSAGEWTTFNTELPLGTKYVAIHYYGNHSYYTYVDDIELAWARYHITVTSADSTQGTVAGSSTRNYNATATIRAFPTACYQFSHWNDGNTDNPRTVTVTQDSTFTAYFTPATLTGSETVAACESYRWGGTTYRNGGTYTRHVTTAAGCDSVATLHLTINHGTHNVVYDTTSSIPYIWHDSSYTTAGVYTYSYTNAAGCASTDTLYLEISNPCPALSTLPYTENFDTLSNGNSETFVPCWHRVSYAYSITAAYPFVSSTGRNNTNGLYWSHATNATDYEYVALPAIDTTLHPIRTLKLTFWARATSNQPRIEVGVMSDPEDTNTFVPVRLLSIESSTWTSRTTYFNNYNGHGQYLALRGRSSNANWNACLDDFTIDVAPACIEPVDIVALTTTATTATLSWQGTAQSYTIAYGTGNNPAVMDSVSSNSNSVTLSGLTANTEYHVFGRSYCSNGQHSGWSEMYTFHTECASITTLPYSEGFENANTGSLTAPNFTVECWKRFNNGTTYYAPFVSTIRHAGSKGLSWTLYNGETYGTSHFVVLPGIEVPNRTLNALRVSFWGRVNTAAGQCPFQVGVMTDINDTNTFTPVGTVMVTGNTWTEYTIDLASYTGTGIYIALRNLTPASYLVAYTDDFTVSVAPTCFPPDSVIFSNITSHSATATWSANAGSYVVAYGTGTNPDAMDSLVVTSGTATLDNLTSNTDYHVFVRSVCNDERSVWSAMYTFHTECGINALPFTDGFESYSAGSVSNATFTAACWTRHNNASSYHVPIVGTTGRTSTRGITWNMNGTVPYGTSHYLVLPAVEVPGQAVNTLQLTFWARCYSNNYTNHFQVGVMTDRNDTNTFTPVSDVTINSGSWTEFTTYLIPYTGTGKYIALRSRNVSNGNNVFFDDFTVDLAPTCFPPTGITVSGITANSATVAWTGTAGTYKVAYGTGTNPDAMDYVTITGNSTTLTGLTPMTDYNVYLQSICPDTHSFWSEATAFTTACGRIIAFPFTEDFEGYPTGSTSTPNADFGVPCWTHINNGSIYTGSPYIFYSQHHSGTQSLWWQMPNYNNAQWPSYQMLVLPGVDNTIDLRELRLTCWIGSTSNLNANSIFYVGVMTDPNNVNTFTQVATVPLESSSWQEYHVDFNNYNGNGKYIALRTVRSNAFWGASMDDVTLDYIPPTVIDTVAVACDSFTWNNTTYYTSGNYTRPHTEHNITVYDTLHLTINHGTHNVEYDTAEASYTWHGTTYNTTGVYTYNYTNTEGCASTDTLYLEIIDPYAPVLVDETHPFFDGFENGDRWQKYHGELPNKWFVGTATSRDGANALYVSNNNGVTNEYTITSPVAIFAAKSFILPTGHYYFSYDWKGYGESTYDFLRVALAPASAVLTPGTNGYSGFTTTQVPSGWIPLDGNLRKNQSNTWQTYTAEANITTAGIYQMVFYWRNDNSQGTQPPAGVDNVNILKTNCVRPTNVAASNITGTTATLTWNGTASSYQVAYGTMESINEMTLQTANGTTLQLSGLSPSSTYNVYVRALCSATDQSPWSTVYSFTTNCGALTALPYIQGFEESTSGSSTSFNVNCWSRYSSSGNYPYVTNSSSYAHTGTKTLYWYSSSTYTQYIVMPEVETNIFPINSLRLKFWTKVTSTSYHPILIVGVMTNPTDLNTFAPIQSIDCSGNSDYRENIVNLNSYTGTGRYIAIRAQANSGSWTVYVDDFTLEEMPACPEPTNITTITTTTTTATLAWAGMNASSYTVAYGTGTNPNSMDTVRVNAAMVTLTGLSASTEYHLYVRANCTGESSNWSQPCTFRTQCGLITTLPYIENINSATTSSSVFDIPCWQRLASSYYPYASTVAGRSGAGLYWYCPNTTGAYQYAILPAFDTNLHPIRTLKLTFWSRSSSTSYHPRIQVGVMSNTLDTHSFTPIGTIDIEGTAWTEQTVYFNNYHGTGMNIAVRGVQTGSTWYGYLDDFTIDVAPICIEPTGVTATAITASSAHLSWTGSGTSYTVAYGTGVSPTGMTTQTTTATALDLTGLTPNTEYNVFVRSECTGGLQSEWSDIYTFRTECNAITTLPYNEGFEGYPITSNIMPDFAVDCWKRHTNGTTTYIPYTYAIAHTGNRGLFWSLNYSASYGSSQTVVLPSFEVPGQPVNTLQLTFWARGSAASATGTFQVGVMTDPYDTTTFTPVSTLTVAGSTWMEYITLLNTYNGTGTHIALRHNNSSNDDVGSAYFDDFSVTVAPTCDTVVPVVTTLAVCESHTWHGQTYTATGTYTFDTLVGTCSRTDTLHLTVNHGTHNVVVDTACESYTWHGQAYTAAGVYTYNYTNVDGCASTDTLHLTVNHGTHDVVVDTACESYTWQGQAYTATGVYTYNYTNADGCASTDTLHLTINHGTHNSVTEMVDESYTWHGSTYTATGIYTYDYTNADGCPSTDTLHLTVDPYMPVLVNETHPFNDGFEGNTLRWQLFNGSQTNKWYRGAAAHSNGSNALYVSNDNGATNAYSTGSASTVFATKKFILPAGHFYFSYDWRANGENNYDYMRVYLTPANTTVTADTLPTGVSTTGTPTGWTVLDRGRQMNMSTDWSNYTAEVNITDSAIYQVVFIWNNDYSVGNQPPAGIDEVTFIKSDCYSPTGIAASNITDATATLSWTGNATSYMVVYGTSTAIGDMDTVVVAGNTTTLTGLAHTTTHYVYVKSICSATDFSPWSSVYSFRTACGAIALPYSYGIDDPSTAYYNTMLAECWTAGNSGDNANNDPSVSTYYAHDGALSLYMTSSNAYYSYVVLPRFDNPVNRTQMTFWGHAANNSNLSTVEIGVVNSPSDMSSFVLVDTAYFLNSGVLNWHEKEVVFDTYTGNGQYIAIRLPNTGNGRVYLDDFTVEAMPECSGVRNLAVTATTENSVTLTWRETGAGSAWSVEYGPQGFAQGSGTLTTVSTTTATITGLTNNTWYDFYVHSDCAHSTSVARMISAQTDCGRMAIPFLEDFNRYAGSYSDSPIDRCWYKCYSQNNSQTSYPQFTYNSSDNSNIFLSFTSTRNYYSYLVLPFMQGNIHDQMLRFKAITSGGNTANIQVGVMTDATNFNTFQQVQQLSVSSNSEWVTLNVPFNSLSGANYRIAIVSPRMNYSGNPSQGFYVDDVEVVPIPDCNAPTSLAASNITTTGATLHWNAATGISRYRVVYTPYGDYDSTYSVTVDSVSGTSLTLTGLQMGTTYDVEVYSLCVTGSLSMAATTTFSTSCAAHSVPFTENFDHGNGTYVSPCWNNGFYGSSTASYPSVNSAYPKYDGDKSLLFWSSSQNMYSYAVLPTLDDTLSLLQLSLFTAVASNQTHQLQIGTVAASGDITTFQNVQSLNLDNYWRTYTVSLSSVTNNSRRIAIRYLPQNGSQTANIFVDDIVVERIPACDGPARVRVDNILYNQARAYWPAVTGVASYNLEYGPTGFTLGQGTQVTGITDTSYLLTGLTAGTAYSVYLTAACSSTSQSSMVNWSFSTGCLEELPYEYGFEGLTTSPNTTVSTVPCWFLNEQSQVQVNRYTTNFAAEGYARMRFNINQATAYAVMPKMNDTISNLYMTLQVNIPSSSYSDETTNLIVGVVSDPYDFTTFIPVDTLLPTATDTWESHTVNFSHVVDNSNSYYIAFRSRSNSWYNYYVYFDDIRVMRIEPFNIDLTVAEPARGTVSINGVTTNHAQALAGSNVTLTATANHGYTFSHWAAGITANPYTFTMPDHDVTYNHIVFSLNTYTVTVVSNDTTLGTVTGGGTFDYLDTATLTATPNGINTFLHWSDGVTANPRTLVVTDDTTLTAIFQNNCPASVDTTVVACDNYLWHGQNYTASGVYAYQPYPDICNTVDTLRLTVNHSDAVIDTQTACESYRWINGVTYTASTNTPTVTLTNTAGCDSTVTLNLTINYHSTENINRTTCDSTTFHGNTYYYSGTYYFDTVNEEGCDHLIALNLTLHYGTHDNYYQNSCGNYRWNGTTYTATGTYTYNYTNSDGCASTDTLHLVIDQHADTAYHVTACDSYRWNDSLYTQTGVYTYNYSLAGSTCTNVDTLYLTVNYSAAVTLIDTACDSYTWHDSTYVYPYPSGYTYPYTSVYTYATTTAAGCDSVETLNLTLKRSTTGADIVTACDSYTWIDGNSYTASTNTATHTLTAANGCDSVVTLFLTVNHSSTGSETASVCDSYLWHGRNRTVSGVYTFDTVNAAGCDSTVTLNLTINHGTTSSMTAAACDSYTWHGSTYTATGVYTFDSVGANGCNNTETLTLTVYYGTYNNYYDTAELHYTWHGTTYDTSGDYTYTYANADGCPSTDTLHLVIDPMRPVLVDETHPFFDDFEEGCRWNFTNGDYVNRWYYGTAVASTGTHSIYISEDNGVNNTYNWDPETNMYSNVYASKRFILTPGAHSFSYDWHANGAVDHDYLRVFLAPDAATLPAIFNGTTPTGWIALDGDVKKCGAAFWTYYAANVNVTTAGIYKMVFVWRNDPLFLGSGHNPAGAVDNVSIVKTTCTPPTNLHNSDITTTSATVAWTGTGTRYTVAYGIASTPSDMDTLSVTGNSIQLTGLSPSSEYHLFVRKWCGDSQVSAWSAMYTFQTSCGALSALPYTEDFESFGVMQNPNYTQFTGRCWTTVYNNASPTPRIWVMTDESFVHSGTNTLSISYTRNDDFYLVMPQLDTHSIALNNLYVGFWAYPSRYNVRLVAGVMNNPYDTASFDVVDTLDINPRGGYNFGEYGFSLRPYMGTGSCIALRPVFEQADSEWYMGISFDDFIIDYLPQPVDTTVEACDSFTWGDTTYTTSGIHTRLRLFHGLTLYDTIRLTIHPSTTGVDVVDACDSLTWIDGVTYRVSTSLPTYTVTDIHGCDSVVTLNLTIHHPSTGTDVITACDRYTWVNGITYTANNYGSTYTLTNAGGCDSILTLDLTIHHSSTGGESVMACNSYTWHGNSYTASGVYTFDTTNAEGCDSTATLTLTVNHSTESGESVTACDSYTWHDSTYTATGLYTFDTLGANGCDSTVTLTLTVNHSTTGTDVQTACNSYTWMDGMTYTTSTTTPTYTLTNAEGCDSVVTLDLTLYNSLYTEVYDTACEQYIWLDNPTSSLIYDESGDYSFTTTATTGCDSTVTLHLTIHHGTHDDYYQHACDTFVWHGTAYTATGTYLYEYLNADGCTSVDTLHLTVDQHSDTAYHVSACDAYRWNDSVYTESGIYVYDYSLAGSTCTNVDTLYLTVNHSADSDLYVTACDSYNWLGTVIPEGDWYTESGTYVRHMQTAGGCDSTATLHLTLNHRSELDTTLVACDTLFWTVEDTTFTITESGDYFVVGALLWTVIDDSYLELGHAFLNAEGCDSTQTLHVTIGHSTTGDTVATACDSFEWYGTSYTSSTSATRTTSNAAGCDSVVTLHLTVNYSTAGDTVATACDHFEWRDSSYTSSTSATSTTTNAAGCDSVVTLHLTVNYGIYTSTYTAACDTFAWHDSVYTSSGTYLFVDETAEGCPMVDTLVLTLSTGTSTGYHVETCDGYIWNGTLYTETGNYIYDYSQLGGDCQNVDTLFLLIHHSTYTEVFDTACDSYTWFGTDYTSSTNERMITRDVFGCDSTVALYLTIHYNTSTAYTDTLGEDGTYTWHGQTYSDTGTYLYDYITDEGCASTDTLYLLPGHSIPVYYTLHARSADTVMGYVVVYPDSVALCGDTVIVVGVPHEGYRFTHWSDGDTNGARMVRLTSDTTLVAYFEVYVGIADVETPTFRIWAETGNIQVEGTGIAGMPVRAYDLTGRMLYNQRAEGNRVTISTSRWATGVYLVRVGNLPAQRIVLR